MQIQLEQSLKKYLRKSNLTQNQLAVNIGIRPSSLHAYLNGAIPRGLETIIKIASELNLSLDELVFNHGAPERVGVTRNDILEFLSKYETLLSKKIT